MAFLQRYGLRWRMSAFGAIALLPILGLLGYHASLVEEYPPFSLDTGREA